MAKQVEKEFEEGEEKKINPFQKFIYIVLIPLLFATTVGLIVATVAGVNIFSVAQSVSQKIPFAGNLFQKNTPNNNSSNSASEVKQLQAQIKNQDQQIAQLQSQIDNKNTEIQQATLENSKIQQQMNQLSASQQASKKALTDIVNTYQQMSPKKAAPIIAKMPEPDALKILNNLPPDVLAGIMQNLDPTQAAKFTQLMTASSNGTHQ